MLELLLESPASSSSDGFGSPLLLLVLLDFVVGCVLVASTLVLLPVPPAGALPDALVLS